MPKSLRRWKSFARKVAGFTCFGSSTNDDTSGAQTWVGRRIKAIANEAVSKLEYEYKVVDGDLHEFIGDDGAAELVVGTLPNLGRRASESRSTCSGCSEAQWR
jgi:hypothetical protein